MGSLVLDFLLVIIFLMMIPIGFYRGGLREMCVSGGLLLGILMSQSWGEQWSGLLERLFGMGEGGAAFLMSVIITFTITGLIGYGGSAAFTYKPGPGGRLYGAYLALFNAMIATGFLINIYSAYIVPTGNVEPVTSGIIARSLSDGFGSVLLVATIGVGMATVFGLFVRDRSDTSEEWQPPQTSLYQQHTTTRPYHQTAAEPVTDTQPAIGPVRILEVKDWEESEESSRPDPTTYGSGWRQTWPDATPAQQRSARNRSRRPHSGGNTERPQESNTGKNVLADWMKDQNES